MVERKSSSEGPGCVPAPVVEEIAEAVRSGRMAARSAVRDALGRIDEREGSVHAWVHLDRLADRKAAVGRAKGALAGVPFGVKDLIDLAGAPTAFGLSAGEYQPAPAVRSAVAVARLEAHSAVPIGKTVTTALALDRPGPTRNPCDLLRSPGASSSGSAAAVAAGMVPLALGSQTIGSVIRPASYCGVWAFLPSSGTVPDDGSLVSSPTLDRVGLFASTSTGLVLAGLALLDRQTGAADAEEGREWRIAVLDNAGLSVRAPEPTRLLDGLLRDPSSPFAPLWSDIDFSQTLDAARTIAAFELHRRLQDGQVQIPGLDGGPVAALLPLKPSEGQYRAALSFQDHLVETWGRLTDGIDAVLLPAAAAQAPLGLLDDQDPAPAALGSLLGLPTVNIPLFTSQSGLPIGCQLLARKNADLDALRIADRLAAMLPGSR